MLPKGGKRMNFLAMGCFVKWKKLCDRSELDTMQRARELDEFGPQMCINSVIQSWEFKMLENIVILHGFYSGRLKNEFGEETSKYLVAAQWRENCPCRILCSSSSSKNFLRLVEKML